MSTIELDHSTTVESAVSSRGQAVAGRVVTTVVALLLTGDAVTHLLRPSYVDAAMADLGWPLHTAPVIGALMLVGLVLHLVPRTRVIGALVITGYLGGAVGAQVRMEAPVATCVFPAIVAAGVWAGLCLRDPAVRRVLLPTR